MHRKRRQEISAGTSQGSIKRKAAQKYRKSKAAGFFDEEAELGSDDEANDDNRKAIDKNDAEENEDGLDDDLDGFVDNDDIEIGDAEQGAHDKF